MFHMGGGMSKSLKKRIQRRLNPEIYREHGEERRRESRFSREPAAAAVLNLFSFKYTTDAILDEATDKLPDAVRVRMEALIDIVKSNPASVENEVLELSRKYPDVMCFRNWYCSCLRLLGRHDEVREFSEILFREHPDYFFARTTLADLALEDYDVNLAAQLLGGEVGALLSLYPDQEVFHITEARHWFSLWGRIELMKGNLEAARSHRKMLHQMEPDSVAVQGLDRLMNPEKFQLIQLLANYRRMKDEAEAAEKMPPVRRGLRRSLWPSAAAE